MKNAHLLLKLAVQERDAALENVALLKKTIVQRDETIAISKKTVVEKEALLRNKLRRSVMENKALTRELERLVGAEKTEELKRAAERFSLDDTAGLDDVMNEYSHETIY